MKLAKLGMLFSVCLMGALCACKSAPEEVRENMQEYGENKQLKEKEITYCTWEELRNTKASDINIEDCNIEFPDKVDFSGIQGVGVLKLTNINDLYANREKYFDLFGIDRDKIVFSKENVEGEVNSFNRNGTFFCIAENGSVVYTSGLAYGYRNDEIKKDVCDEIYDLERDDISNVDISLNGEKDKLQNIADRMCKWVNDNFPASGIDYAVTDACTKKLYYDNGDNKELLSLVVERVYKGIHFNNHVENIESGLFFSCIEIDCDSPDKISYFFNGGDVLSVVSEESVDKIVDLNSAANIVNCKMSGFAKRKIAKIVPLYITIAEGYSTVGRPMYAFLIECDPDECKEAYSGIGMLKVNACSGYILVDMVTGESRSKIF